MNQGRLAKTISIIIVACVLVSILMLPYAKNGFWADDSLNSQTWGMVNRFHTDAWSFSIRVIHAWITQYGRILLPWPAIYEFFYVVRNVLVVRLIDIALLFAHIGLTVVLLRRAGAHWRTIGFFLLVLVPLFQIRGGDDPIGAYATFSQMLGILLVISLMLLQAWYEKDRTWLLVASSGIAVFSMLCYEINVIFIPIALVAVLRSPRARLKNVLIVLVPFVLFVVAQLICKHMATNSYDGSQIGGINAIPVAYAKQIVGAFPGSFYAFSGHTVVSPKELLVLVWRSGFAWLVAASWIGLLILLIRTERQEATMPTSILMGASVFLLVPPALIAISAKYQASLTWGFAHIPVYYEYFGLAVLIAVLLDRLASTRRMAWVIPLALLSGLYVAANWEMNMHQSAYLDAAYREPRDSFVTSLRDGLFNRVRDGDVIRIENQPIFINGNLIYQAIQKRLTVEDEAAISGWFKAVPRPDARHYRVWRDASDAGKWKIQVQ